MMSMKKLFLLALLTILFYGCNNLEDAELTDRKTFMHFYESANSFVASSVDITDGGYLITGYIPVDGDRKENKILVIKTDGFGQPIWKKIIDGGSGSSLIQKKDGAGNITGYVIVGDSVVHLRNETRFGSRLVELNLNGDVLKDLTWHERIDNKITNYHATGIVQYGDSVITVGSRIVDGGDEFAVVTAMDNDYDTLWHYEWDYAGLDYNNLNSVYYKNNKIFWAASVQDKGTDLAKAYVALPVMAPNSSFDNSDFLGKNVNQLSFWVHDLQPAWGGFVAVGTYAELDGTKSNSFFIRVTHDGSFRLDDSRRFFDGILSKGNTPLDNDNPTPSEIEDEALAVTPTSDGGFVVAGALESNVARGKGGKDIWLIKLDVNGNMVWNKLLGGESSEVVTAIRETEGGGLLICGTVMEGTSQTGGLSGIFLIKTDSKGNLDD
jgi:hypothetical protein